MEHNFYAQKLSLLKSVKGSLRFLIIFLFSLIGFFGNFERTYAQKVSSGALCSGTLGNPVVTIDFGYGSASSNYGPALASGITNYNYWFPSVLPNPGGSDDLHDNKYAILPRLNWNVSHPTSKDGSGKFTAPGAWHIYNHDHSYWMNGKSDGYMYVVNAAYEPGIFYQQRIDALCSGTTYEFSAYITNLINGSSCGGNAAIKPNIRFQIESVSGTVLGYYETGDLNQTNCTSAASYGLPSSNPTECVTEQNLWQQVGFLFTIPSGNSSVIIKMINNNPGGCGNDLAIDDINFRPCGPSIGMLPTSDKSICVGGNFTFSAVLGAGYSNPDFLWQKSVDNGATWIDMPIQTTTDLAFTNLQVSNSGLYRVLVGGGGGAVSNPNCRVASDPVRLTVYPPPVVTVSGSGTYCVGDVITLTASPGAKSYQWFKQGGTAVTAKGNFATYTFTASNASESGNYYVVAYNDQQTGTNTFIECSQTSNNVALTINPAPIPVITGSPYFCGATSTTLSTGTFNSYKWYNTASPGTILSTSQSLTVTNNGTYAVEVFNGNCYGTQTITVSNGTVPTVSISLASTCNGATLTSSGSNISTRQWSKDGVDIPAASGGTGTSLNVTLAGVYKITVTSTTGCTASATQTVTTANFAVAPSPVLTPNPNKIGLCTGDAYPTLSVADASGAAYNTTDYDFEWYYNGVLATVSDAGRASNPSQSPNNSSRSIMQIIPKKPGTFTVKVTKTAGTCLGTYTSPGVTITVTNPPSVSITGTPSYCAGGSTTLTANPSGKVYEWKNSAGTVLGTSQSLTVSGAADTYTVKVTDQGCSATSSQAVTVNPVNKPSISGAGALTFCQNAAGNASIVLTASSIVSGTTFQWYKDGAIISGATNSTYTATASGSYTVVPSNKPCPISSDPAVVTINVLPTVTLNAAGPYTFCQGGSQVISVTDESALGVTYQWYNGATAIPSATSNSYTATATGQYKVVASYPAAAGGCSATSATVNVTVNPLPTATISASGPTTFCNGGSVTLTAPVQSNVNYQWYQGATAVGTNSNTLIVTTAGSYTVKVTNTITTCSATSPATVVTVNSVPTVTLNAPGPYTFCQGGSQVISVPNQSASGVTYQWYNGATLIGGATSNSYTATATGQYTVVASYPAAAGGCSATSAVVNVTVNPLPVATISPSGPTTFCSGG
ncbi:hypothetical protein NF867_03755, partial [Solitalea sp. MAHUQ-68]|nr:hypothetical protein [Solitalea agri]